MLHQSIRIFANACVFTVLACAVSAETRVISLQEQPDWNAVGRVNKGGFKTSGSCTGTLIAPDLILTAAHCTPNGLTAALLPDYTFVAGWNRGEYAASRKFAQVYLPEGHKAGPLTIDGIVNDIALVRLDAPIPLDIVRPLPLSALPDSALAFLGYRNDRLHAPQMSTDCAHQKATDGVIFMDCEVVSGNSGSPVIDMSPVGPRVVGVVSATAGGGALAITLQDWMRVHLPDAW